MKLNDVKHNHSLTDLLKVLLFAIVMLLPFINVAVRCGYVMFNKNAYQSYSGRNSVNETIEPVENNTTLDINTIYHLSLTRDTEFVNTASTVVWDVSLVDYSTDDTATTTFLESYNQFAIQFSANASYFIMRGEDNTLKYWYYNTNNYLNMSFTLNIETNSLNLSKFLSVRSTTNNYFMDNVFEYSVSQLEESNLYNWTTQTAIYSGVSQMTSQLGITTNIIPIIVVYWFFITIIYIILDIVIRLFTILTHFIGSKTSS